MLERSTANWFTENDTHKEEELCIQ